MIPILGTLNSKAVKYGAIILVIIIILYFSGSWLNKQINKLTARTENPDEQDSEGVDKGAGIIGGGKNFMPDSYAKELFEVIDGIFDLPKDKEVAAQRFFELTRNQKIEVWNYWNKNYAPDMDNETIYGAMADEDLSPPTYPMGTGGVKSYWARTLDYFANDDKMNYKLI